MKQFISAILVFAVMSSAASAQNGNRDDRPDREDRRQNYNRINPRLLDQLALTATQSEQIKLLNEDYRTKMQEMIKSDMTVEERKAKRSTYDSERRTKLLAILTPAQVQKLHELQKSAPKEERDEEYKSKTKSADGEKSKIKVKNETD